MQDRYDVQDYEDALQPQEYVPWMYERMAEAVVTAWESRAQGSVAWGVGQAVAGHNRRSRLVVQPAERFTIGDLRAMPTGAWTLPSAWGER